MLLKQNIGRCRRQANESGKPGPAGLERRGAKAQSATKSGSPGLHNQKRIIIDSTSFMRFIRFKMQKCSSSHLPNCNTSLSQPISNSVTTPLLNSWLEPCQVRSFKLQSFGSSGRNCQRKFSDVVNTSNMGWTPYNLGTRNQLRETHSCAAMRRFVSKQQKTERR